MRTAGTDSEGRHQLLRLIVRVTLVAALPLLLTGCRDPLNEQECEHLLDRYVELLAKSYSDDESLVEIVSFQKKARERARQDPAFKQCSRRVSRGEYECAMDAPTADRLEICLM